MWLYLKLKMKLLCLQDKLHFSKMPLKTGDNGFFRIDDVESGSYFLSIMKEGYAVFGPIYATEFEFLDNIDPNTLNWQKINSFYLKEGQIKHFKIQLEKEAILKINIFKKTPQGTEPANKFVGLYPIRINHANYANYIEDTFRNELTVPYYKEGNVTVEISYQGEMKKKYEIGLEKGKTFVLDHAFDFTVGQVVHGVVKDKFTGNIVFGARVDLTRLNDPDNKYFFTTISGEEFWIGGLAPGLYELYVYNIFNPGEPNKREGKYSITFTIENNDKKEFNIEL